jgi:hypothetical protein
MDHAGPTFCTNDEDTVMPGGREPLSNVAEAVPEAVLMLHVRPEVAMDWPYVVPVVAAGKVLVTI